MSTVRTPKQKRGIQTKQRIMKAAFHLFARKGIHGTNAQEIVDRAGVSVGSFYSYFRNKKTLLLEMLEDYLDRHYAAIWKELNSFPVHDLGQDEIRAIVENVFRAYDISPEFHRQTHALRYSDEDIKRVYDRERKRQIAQVQSLIEANMDRILVTDAYATALVIHNAVENVAHTAKFIGPESDENRLIDELVNMLLRYLFAVSP
jgi:AcrR family transcriptional regulator